MIGFNNFGLPSFYTFLFLESILCPSVVFMRLVNLTVNRRLNSLFNCGPGLSKPRKSEDSPTEETSISS